MMEPERCAEKQRECKALKLHIAAAGLTKHPEDSISRSHRGGAYTHSMSAFKDLACNVT